MESDRGKQQRSQQGKQGAADQSDPFPCCSPRGLPLSRDVKRRDNSISELHRCMLELQAQLADVKRAATRRSRSPFPPLSAHADAMDEDEEE